jgi:hypothetical protein
MSRQKPAPIIQQDNENVTKEIVPGKYKHTTYATKIRANKMVINLNVKI